LSAYEHANMKRDTKQPDDISLVLFIHLFVNLSCIIFKKKTSSSIKQTHYYFSWEYSLIAF